MNCPDCWYEHAPGACPTKRCPECGSENEPVLIRARKRVDWAHKCPDCGHEEKVKLCRTG